MCHVFSLSRAALSAILRDEYLTSGVRTKEGGVSYLFYIKYCYVVLFYIVPTKLIN